MTYYCSCLCGYEATSPEDLGDHLAEIFTPDDDRGPDGQVHAEAASDTGQAGVAGTVFGLACLCGFTGTGPLLDEHLLAVFTPSDGMDWCGVKHVSAAKP